MTDYNDIFDKTEKPKEDDGLDEFYSYANRTEKNGVLLSIYLVVMLLVSFGFTFYSGFVYPDSESILSNLEITEPITIDVTETPDADYLYQLEVNGALTNHSTTDLQTAYIDIEFFNEDNESLGYRSFTTENLFVDQTFLLENELIETDAVFDHFEITYGFDVYNNTTTFFNLLPVMLCSIMFFFIDFNCFSADWKAFKKNVGSNLSKIGIGFAMVYVAAILSNLILALLQANDTSINEATIQNMFTTDTGQLIMLFGLLVVFTPIVEEVIFRKVLYNFVDKRLGKVAAILSSGIIFGLMHVVQHGDFIQAIPYVLMGVVFGYIYYSNHKNIWITIGVHAMNNLVNYIVYAAFILGGGTF